MPNQPYIDITGTTAYRKATGSGTLSDPYVPSFVQENPVDFGTKITDATIPTGGVGNLGWLSAIWKLITDRLPALVSGKIPVDVSSLTVTVSNFPATQPVSMATAPVGLAYISTATVTRAANQTPYTANDVYGNVFELQNIGASGGFVFISSIDIIFNITAVPSGMSAFAVYFYSSTPPSAITDNLPYSLSSGDRASIMTLNGFSLSASLARGGGSVVAETLNINQLFRLAPGSTSIWGYLVTLGAFNPAANSETATIRVRTFAP